MSTRPDQLEGRPRGQGLPPPLLLLPLLVVLHWSVALTEASHASHKPKAPETVTAPVLLDLEPRLGPREGGTLVTLTAMGVNRSLLYDVKLVSVQGRKRSSPTLVVATAHFDSEGDLEFVTPNSGRRDHAGLLVSLCARGKRENLAGPIFFRLYEPLSVLAPATVEPCCSYHLSGGATILISGSTHTAPTHTATVRFTGVQAVAEVIGQVVEHEWVVAETANEAAVWHVFVATPPWPKVEDNVTLAISWNGQQYSNFSSPISFKESKSLFGEVAYGISEQHLWDGKKQMEKKYGGQYDPESEEGGTEEVAVVEPGPGGKAWSELGESSEGKLEAAILLSKGGDSFILSRSNDLTHFSEDLRLVKDLFLLTIATTLGNAVAAMTQVPSVIGFLVGGIVVGPGCLDWITELVQIESLAELGVCLLLFCIGLELSLSRLASNVRAAAAAVLSMVFLCILVILLATYLTETSPWEALCIGIYASLASTPLAMRAIPKEAGASASEAGQLLTIVVTQDVILAAVLAVMPILMRPAKEEESQSNWAAKSSSSHPAAATTGSKEGVWAGSLGSWEILVATIGLLALLLLACRCLFSRFERRRAGRALARLDENLGRLEHETFVLLMLALAFSLAWATEQLGLSLELGAFLAGFLLSCLVPHAAHRAEHVTGSLRDVFVAWFFASIGLVVNPSFLMDNLRNIVIVEVFVVALKLVTGFLPLWILAPKSVRSPATSALRTSWILTHISEFGFVLASKGKSWGILSRHVYLLLVGVNVVSLCLAPWLFKLREVLLPPDVGSYRRSPVGDTALDVDAESAPSPAESPSLDGPLPSTIGRAGQETDVRSVAGAADTGDKNGEAEAEEAEEAEEEEDMDGLSERWALEPRHGSDHHKHEHNHNHHRHQEQQQQQQQQAQHQNHYQSQCQYQSHHPHQQDDV